MKPRIPPSPTLVSGRTAPAVPVPPRHSPGDIAKAVPTTAPGSVRETAAGALTNRVREAVDRHPGPRVRPLPDPAQIVPRASAVATNSRPPLRLAPDAAPSAPRQRMAPACEPEHPRVDPRDEITIPAIPMEPIPRSASSLTVLGPRSMPPEPEGPLFVIDEPMEAGSTDTGSIDTAPAADLPIAPNADRSGLPSTATDATDGPPAPRRETAVAIFDGHLLTASRFLERFPWLLPTASFSIGWLSFFLFQRGEDLARGIAVIALLGWPWLLAENLVGRWLVARSKGRLSVGAVRFVTQQIQQEILFFALPFLFGAMVLEPGQILFVAVAVVIAILVSLDPVYLRRIAPHAGLSSALHAYCTLIAALVVLPVALHLPLDQALPLSLAITGISLLASLPRMLIAAPGNGVRLMGCAALVAAFPLMWAMRAAIPPAGLWVREARITDHIEGLDPGRPITLFETGALHVSGAIAFVAVRAPTGLSQAVVFDWHQEGKLIDRIPAEISGGREAGFRTYSRKQNFPQDSRGNWRVDLRTPQGQLIARRRFRVD